MAVNNLPYSYIEKKTSGNEDWDLVNGTRTLNRVFEGPWDDRYNFIEEYLGLSVFQGNTAFGTVHPVDANARPTTLSVTGVGATNIDTSNYLIKFDRAIITVNYQRFPNSGGIIGNRELNYPDYLYITESFSSETEMLELDDKRVEINWLGPYGDAPAIKLELNKKHQFPIQFMNYSISIPVNTFDLTPENYLNYTPFDLQTATGDLYYDPVFVTSILSGHVNTSTVRTFSGLVFPALTLLFDGVQGETNQNFHLQDRGVYSIRLDFKYNKITWDRKYDVNSAGIIGQCEINPPPYVGQISFEIMCPGLFTKYQA